MKTKLKIEKMHCPSCAMNIDFELEDMPGVISSCTNYAKCECDVEYDENITTSEKIIEKISTLDYKAT